MKKSWGKQSPALALAVSRWGVGRGTVGLAGKPFICNRHLKSTDPVLLTLLGGGRFVTITKPYNLKLKSRYSP